MEGFAIVNGVRNFAICARCGQAIKNVTVYRGKTYGMDCIEVVTGTRLDRWVVTGGVIDEAATAEREARRQAAEAKREEEARERAAEEAKRLARWNTIASCVIDALRAKDLSKVTNAFKLKTIPDLIQRFDETGRLSKKQEEMIWEWFGDKDKLKYWELRFERGVCDNDNDKLYLIRALQQHGKKSDAERYKHLFADCEYEWEW